MTDTTEDPQPGDLAWHLNGLLDPRFVTRFSEDKSQLWLDILGVESGPFPTSNYHFTRRES